MAAQNDAYARAFISPGHSAYSTVNKDHAYARAFTSVGHPTYSTTGKDRSYARTFTVVGTLAPPMVGALPIYRE